MIRLSIAGLCLAVLAGCATVPDDTTAGVGFGDYNGYFSAEREAELRGIPSVQTITPPTRVVPGAAPASEQSLIEFAGASIAEAEAAELQGQSAIHPTSQVQAENSTISDEQDFAAVSARESIESDAERRLAQQEQLVIVQPTAVPQRPTSIGPNIVEYALSTSHPVGQQIYRRSPFRQGRHEANCLAYRSADLAQEGFLMAGGPDRDRQALDPDGDGYACTWNPSVYRDAARAASQ
jgi:hypothetical protein